ncbi:MAG TPA: ABC transporter permease [Polyangiales bacterium]|nr:ABC transporter permease [Polyangiales bacterium]
MSGAAFEYGAGRPSVLAQELATIRVLVARDLTRFLREKSRVAGALLQPLIFWLVIGAGLTPTFQLQGSSEVGYLEYFYPGVLVMVVLFTAIFSTMSVIEDRHSGFLQAVLVAPGSRVSLVLGKCLGSSAVALAQAGLFLLLAPLAGFAVGQFSWVPLLFGITLSCFSLCTLGFAVAWWLDSTTGYHVAMSVGLLPLWILSGAMFPVRSGVMGVLAAFNPMSYAVTAVRRGLYGPKLPTALALGHGPLVELGVLALFSLGMVALAVAVCRRRR